MTATPPATPHIPDLPDDVDTLTAAFAYAAAGLYVVPVAAGSKHPGSVLGKGWQHKSTRDPEEIAAWWAGTNYGIALHVGRSGVLAVDVDNPGALPPPLVQAIIDPAAPPPHQSTRADTPGRGHYLYRMPAGRVLGNSTGALAGGWGEIRGAAGAIIAAPSTHANAAGGGRYAWARTGPIPPLPDALAAALPDASPALDAATDDAVRAFLAEHDAGDDVDLLGGLVASFHRDVERGESRHMAAVSRAAGAMKEARAGLYPATVAADTLEAAFLDAVCRDGVGPKQGAARDPRRAVTEWRGILAWAVAQAAGADLADVRARAAEHRPGTLAIAVDAPTDASTGMGTFWNARPILAHTRAFALSRMVSPTALLAMLLVRAADSIDPHIALPPTIGGRASLNLFTALVGPSGAGKGAAVAAADVAYKWPRAAVVVNLGSGEGMAHAYKHREGKGKTSDVVWHEHSVMFELSEVDTLAAAASRQGATIDSTLRTVYSGERLGAQNADPARRIPVEAGEYRATLVLGVQPDRARPLFQDASGGTPQRFLWLPATSPEVTADPPPEPAPFVLDLPDPPRGRWLADGGDDFVLPDVAIRAIRDAHVARMRGEGDALDGHALLTRTKVAATFAWLDGRLIVNDEDWWLSGVVMAISDRCRDGIRSALVRAAETDDATRGRREGVRAAAAEDERERRRIVTVQTNALTHVRNAGEKGLTWAALRRAIAPRQRDILPDAIHALETAGLVVAGEKRVVWAGGSAPAAAAGGTP